MNQNLFHKKMQLKIIISYFHKNDQNPDAKNFLKKWDQVVRVRCADYKNE